MVLYAILMCLSVGLEFSPTSCMRFYPLLLLFESFRCRDPGVGVGQEQRSNSYTRFSVSLLPRAPMRGDDLDNMTIRSVYWICYVSCVLTADITQSSIHFG